MALSDKSEILYSLSVFRQQVVRQARWKFADMSYSKEFLPEKLEFRVFMHKSLLFRKLGEAQMYLQHNKVINLTLAINKLNGVIIKPGETFSFWKLVGKPTAKKGYKEGLLLRNGEAAVGIGGGLCQLANMIHWLTLHSSLTVIQRYRHDFDPFPDSGRTVPFGAGATLFYNYIDLEIKNNTNESFQFCFELTPKHLVGELRSSKNQDLAYSVVEKDHAFIFDAKQKKNFRQNSIFRKVVDKTTGNEIKVEHLFDNYCEVKYELGKNVRVVLK